MQTFLPDPDFRKSAEFLDRQRLGKQRVECLQLCNTIAYEKKGWANHPCVVMWKPYLDCLIHYGMVMCEVWRARGYKDTIWTSLYLLQEDKEIVYPLWLGSPKLHASHRSNLLRKDREYYINFGWKESMWLDYFWPKADYDWRKHEAV